MTDERAIPVEPTPQERRAAYSFIQHAALYLGTKLDESDGNHRRLVEELAQTFADYRAGEGKHPVPDARHALTSSPTTEVARAAAPEQETTP